MRLRITLPFLAAVTLGFPAAATAAFPHVVAPGESLNSVAAADGLTVDQLAAANGLSSGSQLVSGSTLMIPPQGGGVAQSAAPTASTSSTAGSSAGDGDGDSDDVGSTASSVTSTGTQATAGSGYLVQPGDTLSAIAARAGISVAQLAAANGLDQNGVLLAGSTLHLSGGSSGTTVRVSTSSAATSSSRSSAAGGSYVVQRGDTLSAIAARAGISAAQLAVQNGLDPNGVLLAGSTLSLSGAGAPTSTASAAGEPVGTAAQGSPTSPPYPTPERVSPSEVGSIASANGVPASLAQAVGWQESGFNNDLVSTADARGVMQILPGTWDWIQRSLAANSLAPASAADNVRGGVLMLHSLLSSTGGNPALAAAGYYQGLSSVQQHGMYPDTQTYVNDVLALERHFGGG